MGIVKLQTMFDDLGRVFYLNALMVYARISGCRQNWSLAIGQRISGVDVHPGNARGFARRKLKSA